MIRQKWPPAKRDMPGQPAAKKIWRNTRSRAAGALFEELLNAGCEHYAAIGAAAIKKTPEPMKPIESLKDGRYVAVYTAKGQEDYKGVLAGGRAIAFEAKHTDAGHIEQRAVTEEQKKRLDLQARMGAACFVLVSLNAVNFYRVPWEVWGSMKGLYGRKYMTQAELAPYAVPMGGCRMESGGVATGVHFLADYPKRKAVAK